jgi:chromosome segregation ATPase
MGRRDNAPVGNTCPMIDDVVSHIDNIVGQSAEGWENYTTNEGELAKGLMEKIRSANDSLRTWGNEMCQERDEFEKENDYNLARIKELELEVSNYTDENKELKQEIDDLHNTYCP